MVKRKSKSLNIKILSLYLGLSVFVIASIILVVFFQVNSLVKDNILYSNINFAKEFIDNIYDGDWNVQGDRLYKGTKLINEDYTLVDNIKEITDADVTIFLEDTRVSTTIQENGDRRIGTKADEKVVDMVLKNNKDYSGTADVLSRRYITIYMPIKNASNNVIGMIFVGYPQSYVFDIIQKFMILILLISFGLLAIGSLGFHILLKRDILRPINLLNHNLTSVSELDLTIDIPDKLINRTDEIGDMFKCLDKMVHNLNYITNDLSKNALSLYDESHSLSAISEEMAASSQQVVSSAEEVANGSINQIGSINEIVNLIKNLSDNIDGVYSQINLVRNEVTTTEDKANDGKLEMDKLIESIQNIKSAFNIVEDKVQQLNKSVINISSISDVIKAISEQTNLLALNAAIESARAGEAGRGFAIVADEVRKLAEESKQSIDKITEIILSIKQDTNEVISTSSSVSKYLENQTKSIESTYSSFTGILSSVNNIAPLIETTFENVNDMIGYKNETSNKINTIHEIVMESSNEVSDVSKSIDELACSTEDVASMSEKLTEMAVGLKNIVNKFKI